MQKIQKCWEMFGCNNSEIEKSRDRENLWKSGIFWKTRKNSERTQKVRYKNEALFPPTWGFFRSSQRNHESLWAKVQGKATGWLLAPLSIVSTVSNSHFSPEIYCTPQGESSFFFIFEPFLVRFSDLCTMALGRPKCPWKPKLKEKHTTSYL